MINVTYVGDILLATKVTGDKNVPAGEITFQVDLSPRKPTSLNEMKQNFLAPIKLSEKAANKWGTNELPRHRGLGQVAEEGFVNNQWMEGQFIVIGEEYFSFSWTPISHQIFFGRPTPELSLKLLRESEEWSMFVNQFRGVPPSMEADASLMKEYAMRCLDATTAAFEEEMEDGKESPFSCIFHDEASEECYFE